MPVGVHNSAYLNIMEDLSIYATDACNTIVDPRLQAGVPSGAEVGRGACSSVENCIKNMQKPSVVTSFG